MDFAVTADHRVKLKESEKRDKYLDLTREQKKKQTMEHESNGDTNSNWRAWYNHHRIGTRTGGLGNKRTSGDHPDYSIIKIDQNTESWRFEETCCHSISSKKPSTNAGVKNSQMRKTMLD